jgi:hypothetical protein
MHPDAPRIGAGLLVLVVLALLVTKVDAGPDDARVHVMYASGAAALTKTAAGDVVVRSGAMEPGDRVTGTVTVKNQGGATGAFRIAQSDVLDVPGPNGGRLSKKLRLTAADTETGQRVYGGVLGSMAAQRLGFLRAGEERAYRFTLDFPDQAAADRAYDGSRVETTFDWSADTASPPAARTGRDTTPPNLVVESRRSAGGVLALTCGERCTIVGVSGGARVGSSPPLLPGRPALLSLRLDAQQPLRITVSDRAGNKKTVLLPVR